MNKKVLFGTLSGIIIGGVGLTLVYTSLFANSEHFKKSKNLDVNLCFASIIGSMFGGLTGTIFGLIVSNCIEERSEREAYREFFESQRIENSTNQLVNESTPLLQEHIININNEESLLNTNMSCNHSSINIL